MEKPELLGRSGSDGNVLYQYGLAHRCSKQDECKEPFPRFRIEDTRDTVHNLIIAAMISDHIKHDILTGTSYQQRREEAVRRTNMEIEAAGVLDWFKVLSEADFDRNFPRGADANDTRRRTAIKESFCAADGLFQNMRKDWHTALRVDILAILREIFGDFSFLMPRELAGFAKCRKTDTLAGIKRLSKAALFADDANTRWFDVIVESGGWPDFYDIANISGLNRRHKIDIRPRSTGM